MVGKEEKEDSSERQVQKVLEGAKAIIFVVDGALQSHGLFGREGKEQFLL